VRRDERFTNAKRAGIAWVLAIVTVTGTGGIAIRANTLEPPAPSAARADEGSPADIPEPASLLLFGAGLLAVARQLRRNRRQVAAMVSHAVSAQALAAMDAVDTAPHSQI
jgi:hypothetical protein